VSAVTRNEISWAMIGVFFGAILGVLAMVIDRKLTESYIPRTEPPECRCFCGSDESTSRNIEPKRK